MAQRFHGPVKTLHDAVDAGQPLFIFCLTCGHTKRGTPWLMVRRENHPLFEPVRGFRCTTCNNDVAVLLPKW